MTFVVAAGAFALAGCANDDGPADQAAAAASPAAAAGVRRVQPADVAPLVAAGVTVIDVRTPEEFATGQLAGATLIDVDEPDFADRLGELDRTGEYLVDRRAGNRSGRAVALVAELGSTDVADLDGGVLAYRAGGLPLAP